MSVPARLATTTNTALCLLLVGLTGPRARADDLSRSDKLGALYSNQFSFDARGTPMITIGIIEGTEQVTLQGKRPVTVLPDGEAGARVVAGRRWRISLKKSRAAVVEHYVVLDRVPIGDVAQLRRRTSQWSARRVKSTVIEVGAVFGMKGRVFDNRSFLLCDGPFGSRKAAARRGEKYRSQRWVKRVRTLAQLKRRPSGTIEAVDLDSSTRIRARDAIWFAPDRPKDLLTVKSAVNRSGPFTGQLGGNYRGQLYVTIDRGGKLAVVNALPADQLLAGLVSAEIFPSAPPAALRAQAIAARGNVLTQIGTKNLADPYLTCAWVRCQVYRGAGHEDRRTTKAVRKTRGMVLMRKGGSGLIDAVYHAHCGGHTEHNENVWPGTPDPSLRGKLDAAPTASLAAFRQGINAKNLNRWLSMTPPSWCARSSVNRKRLRWRVTRDVTQLSKTLAHLGAGQIQRLEVKERGRSGRAKLVLVHGTKGTARITGELTIRRSFGRLNSSMFIVRPVRQAGGPVTAFEFSGGGWGHGVGMCQTGAIGMAQGGKGQNEILQHFYQGSEVQRIY